MRTVKITNMVNGMVSVKDPSTGVNRVWRKRGQSSVLPYETVESLLWQDGFLRLIECGVLYIENLKDKQDLGLEPVDAVEPTNILTLTEMQMKNLLTAVPITVFKKELSKYPKIQVDNLIEYAIENNLVDPEKCAYLKQVTGKDIMLAISRREDDKKHDELEKIRQQAYQSEGRRI